VSGVVSLQVQSVLFDNVAADLDRSLDALARAIELGRERGVLDRVVVAWGDCSSAPTFDDDGVAARSERLAAAGAEGLRYTFFAANLGSAEGNNRLWAEVDTDLVLILNPDTVLAPDALVELVAPLRRPGVGLVDARQLPIEHPKDYDPATGDTSWASGACSMVPAAVIREIGGYDSRSFFLYCDDVDFSWRVRLAGHHVVHQPTARVFHDKRLRPDGSWAVGAAEEYWSAEGALVLAHKYSRPGRVAEIRRDLRAHGSEAQRRAVDDFDRRADEDRLPAPIDSDHAVGQFIAGNYARHRY
jgi:GT2 family glycosyltransferase